MENSKSTKRAWLTSALSVLACVAMLIGTTFAWFTDTAKTNVNKIQSGTLDVALQMKNSEGKWVSAEGETLDFVKAEDGKNEKVLWEPGATYALPELRVVNNGNLALKYKIVIAGAKDANPDNNKDDLKLLDVIDWTYSVSGNGGAAVASLDTERHLAAKTGNDDVYDTLTIQGQMQTTAGNDYQNLAVEGIAITVYATQDTVEHDSNSNQYDKDAAYPVSNSAELATALNDATSVSLANDIDPDKTVVVDNKTTALDLNGKALANTEDIWDTAHDDWSLISAQNGAELTISGKGTLKAKENDCYAVDVQDGSTVTIKDGEFVGNIHAIYVEQGTLIVEGGTFSVQQQYPDATKAYGFVLNCYDANRANGTAKIIVKGGTFVNFDPSDNVAEGAHTNFVADGYKVVHETKDNGDVWYTVVAE